MEAADRHPFLAERLDWHFPLETTHSGIPLSNATFGALLWGGGRDIRITVNRADYWDHRGGITWGDEATWENLKQWLVEGDEANLRRVFEGERTGEESEPPRPTRLPMGRVDLRLREGCSLRVGRLDLGTSEAHIEIAGAPTARAVLVRHDPVLALRFEGIEVEAVSVPPDAPANM